VDPDDDIGRDAVEHERSPTVILRRRVNHSP
jgi:hypothetical protein